MKTSLIATVSAIAILSAGPAWAEMTVKSQSQVNAEASTTGSLSKDVDRAAEDIKDDTEAAYKDIKAMFIGDEAVTAENMNTVTIDQRITATGMLGKDILNTKGEKIAKVEDIIVDKNGKAQLIVVEDGGIFGLGAKHAAFDYGIVTQHTEDGDVIAALSDETIKKAAPFLYDRKTTDEKVRVIPANGYSVSELLDANVVNVENKEVANVDNISFRNGSASHIIASFDEILGLGGKKAAMDFDNANLVRDNNGLHFKLSANQSAQFETYKKTARN